MTDYNELVARVVAQTGWPKAIVAVKVSEAPDAFESAASPSELLELLKTKDEKSDGKLPVLPAEPDEPPAD